MIDRITEQPFCQTRVSCWHGKFSGMFNRITKEKFLK